MMTHARVLSVHALFLLLFLDAGRATLAQSWVSLGPDAGPVLSIARDVRNPARVWAATGRVGVYRSEDGGGNWVASNEGLSALDATVVVYSTADVLLLASPSGLFRSGDGGLHWTVVPGFTAGTVGALEADPQFPAIVYAERFFGGADGTDGLFRTTDAGLTWTRLPHPGPQVAPIGVDPVTSRVYAGRSGNCPVASSDLGLTWVSLGCFQGGIPSLEFSGYLPDPARPNTLYVSARDVTTLTLKFHPGGVFKSEDGGASFTPQNEGLLTTSVNTLAFGPDGELYAGTDAGLFVSRDRAASWSLAPGLPAVAIRAIRVGPAREILVGTLTRGVFASRDGGMTWQSSTRGIRATRLGAIALDPRMPTTIWVGSADPGGGIFVTRDGGAAWDEADAGIGLGYAISDLAVDPSVSRRVFAGALAPVPAFAFRLGALFRTEDSGGSWLDRSPVRDPQFGTGVAITDIAIAPPPVGLFAMTSYGLYRSFDSGESWASTPVPFAPGLAIDPGDRKRIYAGRSRTEDAGETWTPLGLPAALSFRSTLAVGVGGAVYAGGTDGQSLFGAGVWRSNDHGESFHPANAGIESLFVGRLAAGARRPTLIAAADPAADPATGRVFLSTDGASSWRRADENLPGSVLAVAIDPSSPALYAAGVGGLYRRLEETASCLEDPSTLCLGGGRFRAQVSWSAAGGDGRGQARPLTADAGAFWFFSANNLELVVKVVDGRAVNGRYWIFAAGLTNVRYDLVITDTTTGTVWRHPNAAGELASYADTSAF